MKNKKTRLERSKKTAGLTSFKAELGETAGAVLEVAVSSSPMFCGSCR